MASMTSGEDKATKTLKSEVAEKEEKILDFWNKNQIFEKTLEKESPKGEFVFYDGPVTSNAKPVFHTLEPFAFKDVIPRFRTMSGFHVRRKGGWDTHGLPVELQIEKKLGFKSKKDIEEYGIAKFNRLCKESVGEYISDWQDFTRRMGYWADQVNAYVTYESEYMESIWNIVKTVNEKGLLYKDYKVLPWCPRCGTALSSHELALGYQDDKDLAVTVEFRVIGESNTSILAWTTTPWTLPGNVALAVHPDVLYVKIEKKDMGAGDLVRFILAKERLEAIFPNDEYKIVKEIKGKDLIGLKYEPLYPFLSEKFNQKNKQQNPEAFEKSYQVYGADFVTTTDGTGIVHTAVMYGQDDFVLGTKIGLPKYHLVKENGHFLDGMDFLSDRFVKDEEVAIDIIKDLAHRGLLFKKEKYEHSYPHCWRCKTPLIYYARDSWYIAMSKLRDELVKENEGIRWEPEHIKEGRFGEWLREIKDWAISRERYWGTPLPIWEDLDGKPYVFGSVDELKKYTKKSGNKYFVMRHGESTHNLNWGISTQATNPDTLTEKGKEQVLISAKLLKDKNIDMVVISPFKRTKETADIVCLTLGLKEDSIISDDRLHEMGVYSFEGKTWDEYHKMFPKTEACFNSKCKGDESYSDVKKRVMEVIYEYESKYQNKNILFVTHGSPGWLMTAGVRGLSLDETYKMITDVSSSHLDDIKNAEVRELSFVPLPHNSDYEVDLHKPYIDDFEIFDEKGNPLKRVKEVMDVWFDSGAMPFAQDHYPFGNAPLLYPADFISEAIDQTRGWFYTLHAIGVLMGKGKAYKNVICLGHVLDKEGKKMSKSIGNIIDPWDLMNKYGVDALRLWMYTVNQPGDSKNFDEKTVDEILKKVFNPVLNIVTFYELYKDENTKPDSGSKNILDRWIISRLNELISNGTGSLEKFKVFESARPIRDFINDFSTWYIRRSRDRFKSDNKKEKNDALSTTNFLLLELMKYMAPFAPFFAEEIYQRIKSENDIASVHLCDWPKISSTDKDLLVNMQKVREVVTTALELRQKAGHKVRQPLASFTIPDEFSQEFLDIISDEVNVKEVKVLEGEIKLDTNLTEELKNEGIARDVIRGVQDARKTENLSPGDKIKLIVYASGDVRSIIESFEKMIKLPTQVEGISYSKDKQNYPIDIEGQEVSVSIVK